MSNNAFKTFANPLPFLINDIRKTMAEHVKIRYAARKNEESNSCSIAKSLLSSMLRLKDINLSGKGNDIMDNSKTQGIISQPLYLIKSKSFKVIFRASISCLIFGTSASTATTSALTVWQTSLYASTLQR